MTAYGLILAGGRGERLGNVRKADLRIGNVPLIERVATRLRPHIDTMLVSIAQKQRLTLPHAIPLRDAASISHGPMAGIRAAIAHIASTDKDNAVLVTVAVDTPFLPEDYVQRLLEPLTQGHAASLCRWGDTIYPTNAAYRVASLKQFGTESEHKTLPHSPKRLLEVLDAVAIDWNATTGEDPFSSCNTLKDLIFLEARAQRPEK